MKTKILLSFLGMAFFGATVSAQMGDKQKRESPPATMEATIGDAKITIDYSQPAVKNREVYGKLVPYGKVWRTGANEATTFETSADITVNGKKLSAGKYSLFTIPAEDGEWTVIFNENSEQWGAYKYDESEDAVRVSVNAVSHKMTERMTFQNESNVIFLDWAETRVPLVIK